MSKTKTLIALAALLLGLFFNAPGKAQNVPGAGVDTIVLSDPGDPYYPLAEEIAASDGLPLARTWAEALDRDPLTILWVAAPERLSDPVMAQAGLALKGRIALPGVGIISGGSLEEARALWQRGKLVTRLSQQSAAETYLFVANGEHATTGNVEPVLTSIHEGSYRPAEMTLASLTAALEQADYLTFSGHGASKYLRLSEVVKFTVQNLPDLPALVIGTASCQTLRPWDEGSIAMGFTRRGAAAYAGFVYSPNSGYLLGDYHGLPFRYTWPDFPIGRVMALQNRGTLQSYANFPFYYLLGDARIALNDQQPYTVVSDSANNGGANNGGANDGGANNGGAVNGERLIHYSELDGGVVPVRIPGGAQYAYVEIPGVGAAANGDFFFNSRVQIMDAQGDKYVLFDHPGGSFSIRLRRSAPWHWAITRPLLDSFDEVVLFSPQNGGAEMMIVLGVLALLAGLVRAWRGRARLAGRVQRVVTACLAAGLGMALALSAYAFLRLPHAAITTKPLYFIPTFMIGAGLLAAAGTLLWFTARGWPGRTIAVLVPALPALLPGLFLAGAMAYINLMAVNVVGASIYGYRLALVTLPAALVLMAVMAGVYKILPAGR